MRKKSIIGKLNDQSGPWLAHVSRGLCIQAKACIRRHVLAYAARVSKEYERQVFCNNG